MSTNFDNIDEQIAKHLAGENSPEEAADLQNWLAQSAENQRYFADLQWLWQNSPQAKTALARPVDTEAALQKVRQTIRENAQQRSLRVAFVRRWAMAAAAVFVLAVAAVWWFDGRSELHKIELAAAETVLENRLLDGTSVALNRLSSLRSVGTFNRRERRVRLTGEAFFEVAPDTLRPFVVEVADLEVKVVGTAFNVDERSQPGQVKVSVSHGKVRVSGRGEVVFLVADESAVCDLASGKITREQTPDPNFLAYRNRVFRFDSTPLQRVVQQLGKVYGVDISLKNKDLADCPLSARYENLPIERVLDLVAESFSLKVEKTPGGGFALDGQGCGD